MDKIFLVDKPKGWTSFDVVAKIRGLISTKKRFHSDFSKTKVGHAGTLDPFATGLLIVLVDSYTKKQDEFMNLDKEYEAKIILGKTSTTGDPEGKIKETPKSEYSAPSLAQIKKILKLFKGKISQTPPIFSAVKIDGKRAYHLARKGEQPKLKKRTINIYKIELLDYEFPLLRIKVRCSSGTYIRSLSSDIGLRLNTGAYLAELRRTKIGDYKIKDAKNIEEIKKLLTEKT